MPASSDRSDYILEPINPIKDKHYRDLYTKIVLRLAVTYLTPLIFLIGFFIFQYANLNNKRIDQQLMLVAESQARILDFFLNERVGNVLNLVDDPKIRQFRDIEQAKHFLEYLTKHSDAFIDLGIINKNGIQVQYVGPLTYLERRNYSDELWYQRLQSIDSRFIVTDCYLGLRNEPHFTIGVKFPVDDDFFVLRASLDPRRIFAYMTSLEKSSDVYISIVSRPGYYQLVHSDLGNPLDKAPFAPGDSQNLGITDVSVDNHKIRYAFAWLAGTDWAVITHSRENITETGFGSHNIKLYTNIVIASIIMIFIMTLIILQRSRKMVLFEQERDIVKTQFQQAAKLATVGELAAGIAHEIGNPLNIIANEVGIMEDYCNPRFNVSKSIKDLKPNFDKIIKAVYRIKDITSKMLTFVRQDDIILKAYNINVVIEDLISGFYENELSLKNITLVKRFDKSLPTAIIDNNQFRQVLINLLNNAADAITPPGTITISTFTDGDRIGISISDTGCGINLEEIDRIFTPFYTTKPVGKGTGLGLSVSYGIIKNLGGDIAVESIPGKGTLFTILLDGFSR